MFKRSCFVLILIFCFSFLAVNVSAARSGEFETYDVEFRALVPDDLFEAIEIELTHKTDNTVLNYCLYRANGYKSNTPVYPGDYSVRVSVANSTAEDYTYIYDEQLRVVASSSAIPFIIIVDNASYDDYSDSSEPILNDQINDLKDTENTDDEDNDPEGVFQDTDVDVPPLEGDSDEGSGKKESGSLLVSFLFSVILIVVVGIMLWIYKNS